jgi:PAS domain S-box-containing protein
MRQYYWLSRDLSDPLPDQAVSALTDSVSYGSFNSTLVSVSILLKSLVLDNFTLSQHSTYQDLANFFHAHPEAAGVLIVLPDADGGSPPVGMISRHRFLTWQLQQHPWRTALESPLDAIAPWWQQTQHYLRVDPQMPLQDVISLVLARDNLHEPLVIGTPGEAGLVDASSLLAAYVRLARTEQVALTDPDVENLRRQHQLILNAIGEGVYGVDLEGNATFVNPAAVQMIGWEVEDLIGQSMHKVLHHSHPDGSPYPREQCPIYAAFQDGIIHRVSEEVFWRKDGTHFPVEYISTPMRDEQGSLIGAVIAFRDITQRKWAEAVLQRTNEELEQRVRDRTTELRQANQQLKELSELRSRVISMVCHEFRNPLNNILLSVSSMGRYSDQLTPDQKEKYLLGITDNVERMTQMIDAILLVGKVETKGIEARLSDFDLVPFCHEIVAELEPEPAACRIQLTCRSRQIPVRLDPQMLRSILTNILANAVRYSPAHSPIQFRLSKRNDHVIFQIKDQGIGIPPEDLPHLFEPFHRGRNVSNIAGTGLGLNIVKRFLDLQHGTIKASSQVGRGTTFTVTLPTTPPA